MKKATVTMAAVVLTALGAFGFGETFSRAQAAYDDGRYAEAGMLYESMLSNGVQNAEVHYNLANASFKNGELPKAVWHYRKAWYVSPRDPDIRANLHFALNAAGATEPEPAVAERLFNICSMTEWVRVAIGAYIAFTLLVMAGLLFRPAKRMLLKISIAPAVAILVSAGGWWHWQGLESNPEWVVIRTDTTALFGPVEGSTAHYKVPLAALVRQHATDPKGWVEIEYDGKKGWVKHDHIRRLSP
jgi:tetratricopeptide (TPR) repeat protein